MTATDDRTAPVIRPATLDDVPEIRSILVEHGNDGPHPVVDIVGPYVRHLVETARALVVPEGDRLVAFGATADTGHGRHLSDLFVRTDRLGTGIGKPLLDRLFATDWPRTTFASDDPRALPIYIRAGMMPLWPGLYMTGAGERVPSGGEDLAIESADAAQLAELEKRWTGRDRSIDHAYWTTLPDADPFVVLDGGEAVAAGCGRARQNSPERALDRLVVRPDHDPLGPIYAALRRVARGGQAIALFPGPNPAIRPLLEAGFTIRDRDIFMASEPDLVDEARLLPNSGLL
jgi:GNAT superfamily N-acetyltransferase